MKEECTEIIIGGNRLKMFFSLSAMAKLVEKYGSLAEINDAIYPKEGNDKAALTSFKEVAEIALILISSAADVCSFEYFENTPEWILNRTTYSEMAKLRDAVISTILRGLSGDLPEDEDEDEELAALNAKKNEMTEKTEQTL